MGQNSLKSVDSELLLLSVVRYVLMPKEEPTDRKARQNRAALGVGLCLTSRVSPDGDDCKAGGEKCSSAAGEKSNPLRFEKQINARPSNSSDCSINHWYGMKKKNKAGGQTLL